MKKKFATALALSAATASLVLVGAPAAVAAEDVDVTIVGTHLSGGTVAGFLAPGTVASGETVPASTTYPAGDPIGWDSYAASASLFRGEVNGTDEEIYLYCAEVLVSRTENYHSVDRTTSGIANAGLVARLVQTSFPLTDSPEEIAPNLRHIAVQAALWYFTDGFVVAESDPFHDAVEALVNATLAAGPLDEVEIDLTFELVGPSGVIDGTDIVGPYTTTTATGVSATFTVDAGSARVFLDAAGTSEVAPGTVLPPGTPFWVQGTENGTVTVTANGTIVGVVGLYFLGESNPLAPPSQTLVSATAISHAVSGSAVLEFTGLPTEALDPPELAATGVDGALATPLAVALALGGVLLLAMRSRARSAR